MLEMSRTSSERPNTLRTEHLDRQLFLGSRVYAFCSPTPSPTELTWKYNSMLTYILVSFLFSFKNYVTVRVKNRVRVRVSSRVWVRVRVRA